MEIKNLPHDECRVTSNFGPRNLLGLTYHNGIDIGAKIPGKEGDNIYAVADGIVRVSKPNLTATGYGYYVVIEHSDFCTLYAHLQRLEVSVGQKIKSGQVIGHMGNTGGSTAAHLHFEIRNCLYGDPFWTKSGDRYTKCIDPLPIIEKFKEGQGKMKDIEGRWSEKEIKEAVEDGVFAGYPDSTFKPEQPLTREQAAVLWCRIKRLINA